MRDSSIIYQTTPILRGNVKFNPTKLPTGSNLGYFHSPKKAQPTFYNYVPNKSLGEAIITSYPTVPKKPVSMDVTKKSIVLEKTIEAPESSIIISKVDNMLSEKSIITELFANEWARKRILNTSTDIPKYPFTSIRPSGFSEVKFFIGSIMGTLVKCIHSGMSLQQAAACAMFSFGHTGQIVTTIPTVVKELGLDKTGNMLEIFPDKTKNQLSPDIQEKLSALDFRFITYAYEILTMTRINEDLEIKMRPNNLFDTKTGKLTVPESIVQDLTRQSNGDFVREFTLPIAGLKYQIYEQKAVEGSIPNQNYIRPVDKNLAKTVGYARKRLYDFVKFWREKPENSLHKDLFLADKLLKDLDDIANSSNLKENESAYASAFNKLRDVHNDFLTRNGIPMHLVKSVGKEHITVMENSQQYFNEAFQRMHNCPTSPWLFFLNERLKNNNEPIRNYDSLYKEFAKFYSRLLKKE